MSYCRFSSDGWKSDVYVYEDVNGGWTTHVAGRRRLHLDTLPQDPYTREALEGLTPEAWSAAHKHYNSVLANLPLEEIRHDLAGLSFNDPTAKACAARLKHLRTEGFHVPDGVIEELESEDDVSH